MSIAITTQVWEKSQHRGTALLVMLAIADFSDDEGTAFPGVERLAKKVRTSVRNIHKILDKLTSSGELVVEHKNGIRTSSGQQTNRYCIQLNNLRRGEPQDTSSATQEVNTGTPLEDKEVNSRTPQEVNAGSPATSKEVNPSSPKPSVKDEPSENQPSEKDSSTSEQELSSNGKEPEISHRQKTDLIKAWWDALPEINRPLRPKPPNVYKIPAFLEDAEAAIKRGLTPEKMAYYVKGVTYQGQYWHTKVLRFSKACENAPGWCIGNYRPRQPDAHVDEPDENVVLTDLPPRAQEAIQGLIEAWT